MFLQVIGALVLAFVGIAGVAYLIQNVSIKSKKD